MQLTKLILKNYQKFKDQEFDFQEGVNILLGLNGVGKSTLSRALLDVFFTLPNTSKKEIQAARPWGDQQLPVLTLEFLHNGLSFKLIKDFQSKTAELEYTDKKGVTKQISGVPEVADALKRILPVSDQDFYKSCGFITAEDLADLHGSTADFKSAVQNIAIEGAANVRIETILTGLEREKERLLKGTRKYSNNPGPVKAAEDRVTDLENKILEAQTELKASEGARNGLQQVADQLAAAEEQSGVLQALLEKNDSFNETTGEVERLDRELNALEEQLGKRDQLQKDLEQAEAALEPVKELLTEQVRTDLKAADAVAQKIAILKDQLGPLKVKSELKAAGKTPLTQFIFSSAALLALGLILTFVFNSGATLLAAVVLVIINAGYWFVLKKSAIVKSRSSEAELLLRSQITLAEAEQEKFVQIYGMDAGDLEQQMLHAGKLEQQTAGIRGQAAALEKYQSRSTLEAASHKSMRSLALAQQQLKDAGTVSERLAPEEYTRKKKIFTALGPKIQELRREKYEKEGILKSARIDHEQVTSLEEQLEQARIDKVSADQELEVVQLMSDAMTHAVSATAASSHELIEQEVAKYLGQLTAGSCTKVALKNDLSLQVFSTEKNDWCDPREELSRGTMDQVYFLTRLAFIRLLFKPGTIPVLMDDPFLTFDGERLTQAMQILRDFARDYQVLFFTFNPALKELGRVLPLNGTAV